MKWTDEEEKGVLVGLIRKRNSMWDLASATGIHATEINHHIQIELDVDTRLTTDICHLHKNPNISGKLKGKIYRNDSTKNRI